MPVRRVLFDRGGVPVPSTDSTGRRVVELFVPRGRAAAIAVNRHCLPLRRRLRHHMLSILEVFERDLC